MAGGRVSMRGLSALVVGGGDDIGAELYGGRVTPDIRVDPARDALEFKLVKEAVPQGLPILGICRGAQIINVALGGTLHADIYEVYERCPRMRTVLPRKTVAIDNASRLYSILKCDPCYVNALHHQSIDRLGAGLTIVGRDEYGMVQAVEAPSPAFLIGVQWHPELLIFSMAQQQLFASLVASTYTPQRRSRAVEPAMPAGD
jgi:putative glutamine amidotransferase